MTQTKYMPAVPTRDMIEAAAPILRAADLNSPARVRRTLLEIYQEMRAMAPTPPTAGLTKHQRAFQEFVADYLKANSVSPTLKEIAKALGMSTREEAFSVARSLEAKRVIERSPPGAPRNIRLRVFPGDPLPKKIKSLRRG